MSSPVHKLRNVQVKLQLSVSFCRFLWRDRFNLQLDWGFILADRYTGTAARKQSRGGNSDAGLLGSKDIIWWRSWHKQCGYQQTWGSCKHCSWYQLLLTVEQQPAGSTVLCLCCHSPHSAECFDKGLHVKHAMACFRRKVFLILTKPDNWI